MQRPRVSARRSAHPRRGCNAPAVASRKLLSATAPKASPLRAVTAVVATLFNLLRHVVSGGACYFLWVSFLAPGTILNYSPPALHVAYAMRYMSLHNCSRFLLDEDLASMRASLQHLLERVHRFRLVDDYYLPGRYGIADLYREGPHQGVVSETFSQWRFRELFDRNFSRPDNLFNLDLKSHFIPVRRLLEQLPATYPPARRLSHAWPEFAEKQMVAGFASEDDRLVYPGASFMGRGEEDVLQLALRRSYHGANVKIRVSWEVFLLEKLLRLDRSGVAAEFWLRRRTHWNYLLTVYCARSRGQLYRAARYQETPEVGRDFREHLYLAAIRSLESGGNRGSTTTPDLEEKAGSTIASLGRSIADAVAASAAGGEDYAEHERTEKAINAPGGRFYQQSGFRNYILKQDPNCFQTFQLGCFPKFHGPDLLQGGIEARWEAREKRQAMTVWAPDYEKMHKNLPNFLPDLRVISRHESRRPTDMLTHADITPGWVQHSSWMARRVGSVHLRPRPNMLAGVDHPVVIQALHNQLSYCVQRRYPLLPPEAVLGHQYLERLGGSGSGSAAEGEEKLLDFYVAGGGENVGERSEVSRGSSASGSAAAAASAEDPDSDTGVDGDGNSVDGDVAVIRNQAAKQQKKARAWAKILQLLDRSARIMEKLEDVSREYESEDNSYFHAAKLSPGEKRRKRFREEKVRASRTTSSSNMGVEESSGDHLRDVPRTATEFPRRQRQLHFERLRQRDFRVVRGVPDEFWMSPEAVENFHTVPLVFALPIYDYVISNSLRLFGTFVENELQFLVGLTMPGEVFVDVGANIGAYAIPLCKWLSLGGIPAWHPIAGGRNGESFRERGRDSEKRRKWVGAENLPVSSGGDSPAPSVSTPTTSPGAAGPPGAAVKEETGKGKGKGSAAPPPEQSQGQKQDSATKQTQKMLDGAAAPVLYEPGHVYAFEPFRTLFQKLNANAAVNGIENLHAFNFGLSDGLHHFRFATRIAHSGEDRAQGQQQAASEGEGDVDAASSDEIEVLENIPGPDMRRLNYHQMYVNSAKQRKDGEAFRQHNVQPRIELRALDGMYFRRECLPSRWGLMGGGAWTELPPRFRGVGAGVEEAGQVLWRRGAIENNYIQEERKIRNCPNKKYLLAEMTSSGKDAHPPFSVLKKEEVPWNTMLRFNKLDLMKVDIEGQFESFFYGAWHVLEYFRPTLVFENDNPEGATPTILEKDLGYACVEMPATLNDDLVCVVV